MIQDKNVAWERAQSIDAEMLLEEDVCELHTTHHDPRDVIERQHSGYDIVRRGGMRLKRISR